jgi:hypothetical protein
MPLCLNERREGRGVLPEELPTAYVSLAAPVCSGCITRIVLPVTGSFRSPGATRVAPGLRCGSAPRARPEEVAKDLRLDDFAECHAAHRFLEGLRGPRRIQAGRHRDVPGRTAAQLGVAAGQQFR